MSCIPIEKYRELGTVLKTIISQMSLLNNLLNSIHWTRQANQVLSFQSQFEQLAYSLEHKMSKDYTDGDVKGVFF